MSKRVLLLVPILFGLALFALLNAGVHHAGASPSCDVSWAHPLSGQWDNAANWDPPFVPTNTDHVCITVGGTYTVTVDYGDTLDAAASLQVGGTAGEQTLAVEGTTVGGYLGVPTQLTVGSAGLTIGPNGIVDLVDQGSGSGDARLDVAAGAVTNLGKLQTTQGPSGREIDGSIVNSGVVSFDAPTTLPTPGATFTNTGTWGGGLAVGGPTLTQTFNQNAGSLSGTVSQENGAFNYTGGTIFGGSFHNVAFNDAATGAFKSLFSGTNNHLTGAVSAGQYIGISGGSLTTGGPLANDGDISLDTSANGAPTVILDATAGTLTNTGTLETHGNFSPCSCEIDGSIVNSGVVSFDAPTSLPTPGATFTNTGTWGGGLAVGGPTLTQTFNQNAGSLSGTVSQENGTFNYTGGTAFGGSFHNVAFNDAATGVLAFSFTGTNNHLTGAVSAGQKISVTGGGKMTTTSALTNAGEISLSTNGSGPASAILDATAGVLTNTGNLRSLNNSGPCSCEIDGSIVNSGVVSFDAPTTLPTPGATFTNTGTWGGGLAVGGPTLTQTFNQNAGSLSGTVSQENGAFNYTGGTIFGGSFHNVAFNDAATGAFKSLFSGTNNHLTGAVSAGQYIGISGGSLTTGGPLANDGDISLDTSANGAPTVILDATAGTLTNTGTLETHGNFSPCSCEIDGSIVNSGVVSFDAPTSLPTPGATFTNTGTWGGGLAVGGPTLTQTFNQNAGSLSGTVSQENGTFNYTGGTAFGGSFHNVAFNDAATGVLAFSFTGTNNHLTGAVSAGQKISVTGGGKMTTTSALTNAGEISLSTNGSGPASAILDATAGVLTNTGNLRSLNNSGPCSCEIDGSIVNSGVVSFDAPTTLPTPGATFTNTGTWNINSGLELSVGPGSTFDNETPGMLGGTGATIAIRNANLRGTGTINGTVVDESSSTVTPGTPGGVLAVSGTYGQDSTTTMNVGIGGTNAGSDYGQLAVSGAANLAGGLHLDTFGGYAPALGDSFAIVKYASHTGTFSTLTGSPGPRLQYQITYGASEADVTIVAATPTSITISPAVATVAKGLTQQYTATGHYSDGSTADVTASMTWTSSNPAVATITNTALATGLNQGGPVTITATGYGYNPTATLTVSAPVLVGNGNTAPITISPAVATVAKGLTQQYTATGHYSDGSTADVTASMTWTSSNPAVATITNTALATGLNQGGPVTITATGYGYNPTATLTVSAPVLVGNGNTAPITISPAVATVAKGLTQQYTATGHYSDGSTADVTASMTWTSSNPAVATITNTALATGLNQGGPVTITATGYGYNPTATLTVSAPVLVGNGNTAPITISPAVATVAKGLTQQYTATGHYSDGSTADVTASMTWTSSNPAVATITNTALATGLNQGGPVTITATGYGYNPTATLTVSAPVLVGNGNTAPITISPAVATVAKGLTQQYTATGHYSDGSTADVTASMTWTSSNPAVATITNSGLATGLNQGGPVTITATGYGYNPTATLTISAARTTTTVTSSVNPSGYGQTVTFTATVSPSNGEGTISFTIDAPSTPIAGCATQPLKPVGSSFQATCTSSALGVVGAHTVTATYSGDSQDLGSAGTWAQTISKGITTLSATPAVLKIAGLNLYLFTLHATLSSYGHGVAGESVIFTAGATVLCNATTGVGGQAVCNALAGPGVLASLLAGGYSVSFSGDIDYLGSSGTAGLLG